MSETSVVISRKRASMNIETSITEDGTSLKISLPDFIEKLKQEVRLPELKLQTKKGLEEKETALRASIESGVLRVIEQVKANASRSVRH